MIEKRELSHIRAELGVKQTALAREAGLNQSVISRIEKGEPHGKQVYLQVFYGINRLRQARGWPALAYEEIDWPPQRE